MYTPISFLCTSLMREWQTGEKRSCAFRIPETLYIASSSSSAAKKTTIQLPGRAFATQGVYLWSDTEAAADLGRISRFVCYVSRL